MTGLIHTHLTDTWPVDLLTVRIKEIKDDGIVTESEREDFLEILKKITGTRFSDDGAVSGNVAEVWFDNVNNLTYKGKKYVFLGLSYQATEAIVRHKLYLSVQQHRKQSH